MVISHSNELCIIYLFATPASLDIAVAFTPTHYLDSCASCNVMRLVTKLLDKSVVLVLRCCSIFCSYFKNIKNLLSSEPYDGFFFGHSHLS
jgi:hypothetical protein